MSPDPAPSRPAAVLWVAAGAALLAAALYVPSLANGFVNWDDVDYVTANPFVQGPFGGSFVAWAFTTFAHLNYHPLMWLSLGLDHALWGLQPTGFHLSSLLLYAVDCFLVVLLAWRVLEAARPAASGNLAASAVVGALFVVHPLHVESVAWVSERKDLLYGLFYLLGLLAWLRYARSGAPRRGAYAATLACFVLACLSKPMAVSLPAVLLVLDVFPLRRLRGRGDVWRIAVIEKLPFYAVGLTTSVLAVVSQRAGGALNAIEQPLVERLFVAVRAGGFYLAKTVAPVGLAPYYPHDADLSFAAAEYLAAWALAVGLAFAAVRFRREAPWLAAALAFFVVSLAPVSGIVQVGGQAAADRYMYLAILAVLLPVGGLAGAAWERGRAWRVAMGAGLAVAVLLLGVRSIDQMGVWRDSETLWDHVLSLYPEAVTAHYNRGQAYLERGERARAERSFRRALEIDPGYAPALGEMGSILIRLGSMREAERYLSRAVASAPDSFTAQYNLALALENLGDFEAARPHYEAFVRLAPPHLEDLVRQVRAKLGSP